MNEEAAKDYTIRLLLTQKEYDTIMFQNKQVNEAFDLEDPRTPDEIFEEMVQTIIEDWCHRRIQNADKV